MDISPFVFYPLAGLALSSSLMVIFKKNPVSSAFSLVLVFLSFAGIYALLGAHLVAALQILVYTGAIMVLFIFVIMLLNADFASFDLRHTSPVLKILNGLCVIGVLSLLIWVFKTADYSSKLGMFFRRNHSKRWG